MRLLLGGLEEAREVEVRARHLGARQLEARRLDRVHDRLLLVQVGARGLAGAGEELAEGLEGAVVPGG